MDDFYTKLEQGKVIPIMFWKEEVSKWSWLEQQQLIITLIGKQNKEEQEGRTESNLCKYAKQLADFISQQSNIQRSEREQRIQSTNALESQLPDELSTPEAMKIWDKARKADWINDDYTFKGTKYQMAYAAEIMGGALGLKPKWKPFEILWGYKYFSQTRRESKERFGKVEKQKEIEEAFSL